MWRWNCSGAPPVPLAKYAAAGLPRYWIVDPAGPDLIAFELDTEGGFREVGQFGSEDEVHLDIGPATVSFRPEDLLR